MREEYKAIVDAGLILQIDDPDLGDAWQLPFIASLIIAASSESAE